VYKKVLVALFALGLTVGLLSVIADRASKDSTKTPEIVVYYPKPNAVVTSPLMVRGKAKGTWYFEGEFPLTLYYGVGDSFVTVNAFALGDWMTEDYVDFEVILNFPVPQDNDGLLDLRKNNPSDLAEQNENLLIPVRFHE
jgi:hypothetical protein